MKSRKAKRNFAAHNVLFAKMFPWGLPDNGIDEPAHELVVPVEMQKGVGRRKRNVETDSGDNNNWLQCDACNKWRLVANDLFESLSKEPEFKCPVLTGTSCEDQDDYERITNATGSPSLQPRTINSSRIIKRRKPRGHKAHFKPNIYTESQIPGFGAPSSP
jgi:hypothetical protein